MSSGQWEYGQLYAGGSFLTFNETAAVEKIYPLADRIEAGMRNGGMVFRRAIIVLGGWEQVTPDDVAKLRADNKYSVKLESDSE